MKRNRLNVWLLVGAVALILSCAAVGGLLVSRLVHVAQQGWGNGTPAVATAQPSPTATSPSPSSTPVAAQPTVSLLTDDDQAIVAAQERVLNAVYQRVLPSVVHVRVVEKVSTGPFSFGWGTQGPQEYYQQGVGSGFVWDKEGYIVTNNHVVQGADRVWVTFWDNTIVPAEVVGTDPDSDLAVIKVDVPAEKLHPVTLGDSDALMVGQMVVAIGNPYNVVNTMTHGIISALGRTMPSGTSSFSIPEMIQTDAPINPGNSGGPLLDREGRVIGVNTLIISRSGFSVGIGFAVPVNIVKMVVPALIEEGVYHYAWLGVEITSLTPQLAEEMDLPADTRGALVVRVTRRGPADKAGIRGGDTQITIEGQEYIIGGDVITAINDTPILESDDLIVYLVKHTHPGDTVTLTILRDGKERQIEVTLGERPRQSLQ